MAVGIPDVRMEGIVDHHIVADSPVKSFTIFDSTAEAQVVVDFIIGTAVVEVDVPTVITTKTIVADDRRMDCVQ